MAPEQSTQTGEMVESPAPAIQPPSQPQPAQQQPQAVQGQQQPAFVPYQQYPQSYGQPFQSYQAPYPSQQEPEVPFNKSWHWTKIGLHITNIVFCIVGLAITFSIIGHGEVSYITLVCCPIYVFALVWDAAELITHCVHKFKKGIHPGAHVGVSLLIWLAASIIGGMECTYVAIGGDGYGSDCWDYDYEYSSYRYDEDNCAGPFGGKKGHVAAIAAFTCLVFLVHFILFIGACVDTAKRNALARRPIIIAAGPPYWGPMAQTWQPMPQQQQYAPPAQPQYAAMPQQPMPTQAQGSVPPQANGKDVESAPQANPTVTEYYTPSTAARA